MDVLDFEIEVDDVVEDVKTTEKLPTNFLLFGELENEDVNVYIKQSIYKQLEKYSESNVNIELGSFLIGDVNNCLGRTNVIISDFIEAKKTEASQSTLTFTHKTWEYIYKIKEEKFPDKKILGWQHTHPNYGIFLSNYDMFIQENFFNMSYQIAYVIDPIQNLRGFFQWKNGKVEKLKGFYIYDDPKNPIKIQQVKDINREEHIIHNQDNTIKKLKVFNVFLVVAILLLAIGTGKLVYKTNLYTANQVTMNNKIKALENETYQKGTFCEKDIIKFKKYVVVKGDNLTTICEKENIIYKDCINLICSINNITDSNNIYEGQTLLLPVE